MKLISLISIIIALYGCTYAKRVSKYDNETLCEKLGKYTLYSNLSGIKTTLDEINRRGIEKEKCTIIANNAYDQHALQYKLKLCQQLAAFHYTGEFEAFKQTSTMIGEKGFADSECNTMADFYFTKLTRKQERSQAISSALHELSISIQNSNNQLYGRGSYFNPIYIKVK